MVRILISGGFSAKNKGDAAMQLSICHALRRDLQDVEITILSPQPEIDYDTYQGFKLCRTNRRRVLTSFLLLASCAFWRFGKHWIRRGIIPFLTAVPELREFRRADLVVDLSGDTLTEDYGIACMVSHLMPIAYALLLERPVVLCAQTIGPFPHLKRLARYFLNRVSLITVRETLSYHDLETMGISGPPVYLTSDMAFLLEPADCGRVETIWCDEGIPVNNDAIIGVSVSHLLGHRYSARNPLEFDRLIAAMIDILIESLGVIVVVVPHVTGPGKIRDDREVARSVLACVSKKDQVFLIEGDYHPAEIKGLIGRFQLFVGLRMHANISALGMMVPTFAVAYSRKSHGIMQSLNQGQWVADINNLKLTEFAAGIEDLWKQRMQVRADLKQRIPVIRNQANGNVRLITQLLKGLHK